MANSLSKLGGKEAKFVQYKEFIDIWSLQDIRAMASVYVIRGGTCDTKEQFHENNRIDPDLQVDSLNISIVTISSP